jgi:hypothetical protein
MSGVMPCSRRAKTAAPATSAAVALMLGTRLNPLWMLAAGGFLGGLGLL